MFCHKAKNKPVFLGWLILQMVVIGNTHACTHTHINHLSQTDQFSLHTAPTSFHSCSFFSWTPQSSWRFKETVAMDTTPYLPSPVWPVWFPVSQPHTCTTPHSVRTCLTWEVSGLAHTQRDSLAASVFACLLPRRRLSDGCVLEAPWDYTPVWSLDASPSPDRGPLLPPPRHLQQT